MARPLKSLVRKCGCWDRGHVLSPGLRNFVGGLAVFANIPCLALGQARDASTELTVHSGTWMSLDVSPDGNTIVFDLLGGLYSLPITGGTATRLHAEGSFDAMPRYSPDGR